MKKYHDHIASLVLSLGIAAVLAGGIYGLVLNVRAVKAALSETTVFENVGKQTYKMLNPDNLESGGTGFAIQAESGRTYTMTNAHVCNMTKQSYVVAQQGTRAWRLPILNVSSETDLCILAALPEMKGLQLANDLAIGEKVYLVGHPYLNPLTIHSGFTSGTTTASIDYCEINSFMTQIFNYIPFNSEDGCIKEVESQVVAMDSAPGNSGSAVTNLNGDVVGVLFAGNGRGISLIIPLEQVREYLTQF